MAMMVDKVAVITGGAQGIGEACGKAFLAGDCDVLLADIQEEALNKTAQKLRHAYPQRKIETFVLDVRNQAECFAMADFAFDEWGKIDVLVNSAGIISPCASLDVTQEDWENLARD